MIFKRRVAELRRASTSMLLFMGGRSWESKQHIWACMLARPFLWVSPDGDADCRQIATASESEVSNAAPCSANGVAEKAGSDGGVRTSG